jgi:hypothetical protein
MKGYNKNIEKESGRMGLQPEKPVLKGIFLAMTDAVAA